MILMKKIIARLGVSLLALISISVSPILAALELDLNVNPRLCITDSPDKACKLNLKFHWVADQSGDYCLVDQTNNKNLQCWQQDDNGRWQTKLKVKDQQIFIMADTGKVVPLSHVKIEVLSTHTEDRRQRRRRRNVWSLL